MCDNPDTLVFKGAGVKGISYLGVLRYYEEKGKIKNINVYSGSSAGSFASLTTASFSTPAMPLAFLASSHHVLLAAPHNLRSKPQSKNTLK